jgi:hypothetical protein
MQGMQMDEGDSRLLEPVTQRIIGCASGLPTRSVNPAALVTEDLLIEFGRPKIQIRRITAHG